MYFELKENKPHGTKDNPFSIYHIENAGRSFQIPVHWHDEFEIIYVKSGLLTVSISGESYIGKAGDAFVVSPGNLHLMGSQTGTVDYFTFLFPLKYISFRTDDMLDDKLLEPLNSGHLMINPRVKDSAKELCEQLAEIVISKGLNVRQTEKLAQDAGEKKPTTAFTTYMPAGTPLSETVSPFAFATTAPAADIKCGRLVPTQK